MKITEHNCETGEVVVRDASSAELAAAQESEAATAARIEDEAAQAEQRKAILEKLGITADELRVALG